MPQLFPIRSKECQKPEWSEMTAQQQQQIKETFESLLDCQREERERLLDELCAGDDLVRAEVEALLRAHAEADGFLAGSPFVHG